MAGEERLVVVQLVATKATIPMPDMSILMRFKLLSDIVTFATVITPEINVHNLIENLINCLLVMLSSFRFLYQTSQKTLFNNSTNTAFNWTVN